MRKEKQMSPQLKSIVAAMILVGACNRGDPQTTDPLGETKGTDTIARILTCEATDSEGKCTKKSCKEDDKGDCASYAQICIEADLHWNGTRHAGTCSKV